jgi:DNA repair protein RadD
MELRPYQLHALDQLDQLAFAGVKAPLIVAPTGAGKTVIAAEIMRRRGHARGLFLAPRRELIHQTCRKLDAVGVKYGVLLAGDRRTNLYSNVQVASVDTLISRMIRRKRIQLAPFDYVIVDEAHVGLTDKRAALLAQWPDALVIGLTATPCRSDGKALGRVFDELIEVASVGELTAQGFLVPARYYSISEPDLQAVRTTAGDYNGADLERVMNRSQLVGDIVEHWLTHAPTRRTVVFATSIAHSVALAEQFVLHGVAAEHVDANTPQEEREAIFERFSSGRTQVLTNCTLASIGFDLPELDCVVFARPTKSLGLYLQMLGRGLRPSVGKADCLVLDHAGNVHRHGFATDERYWTLHGEYAEDKERKERARQKKEAAGVVQITCPQCKYVFQSARQCPSCGYIFPPRAERIDTRDGQLVEVGTKKKDWSSEQRMHFFLELAGYGELKDYKSGWAANKYRERFNEWPVSAWTNHVAKYGALDPSIETLRWIKSRMIAYSRAKARGARP